MNVISQIRKEMYEVLERGGTEKWVPAKHAPAVIRGFRHKCVVTAMDGNKVRVEIRP